VHLASKSNFNYPTKENIPAQDVEEMTINPNSIQQQQKMLLKKKERKKKKITGKAPKTHLNWV